MSRPLAVSHCHGGSKAECNRIALCAALNGSAPGGAKVTVVNGNHSISSPVLMTGGNLKVTELSGCSVSISGTVSDDNGTRSVTLTGTCSGLLVLSGTNAYGGGTSVLNGALMLNSAASLPNGGMTLGNGAPGATYTPPTVAPTFALATTPGGARPNVTLDSVPESGTFVLLAIAALAGVGIWRSRVLPTNNK